VSAQSTFFAGQVDRVAQDLRLYCLFAQHALQLRDLGACRCQLTRRHDRFFECTATKAPSRSSLRQLNSWLALMLCLRPTCDTFMPGSYVSLTSAAFSCTD